MGKSPNLNQSGGGAGGGLIGTGTSGQIAVYGSGNLASGDSNLNDGATTANTLTYSGTGGVAITGGGLTVSGSIFSVGGQSAASGTALGVPVVVYSSLTTGQTSVEAAYTTRFTTTSAGVYRIMALVWATTTGGTSYVVELAVKFTPTNGSSQSLALTEANISSGAAATTGNSWFLMTLASGATIQAGTFTVSGTPGGTWSYQLVVERLA